jgi:metallo-beta-lactamase family protein
MKIKFLGAAGTVTGSKHLLKTKYGNVLIDCGLFQGLKSDRLKNRAPFPESAKDIKYILLTHAHLDHCGYLPLLVKEGFTGQILCTGPTRELAYIILKDSARIQEEDAALANMHGYSKHHPALPLYTQKDVEKTVRYFRTTEEKKWIELFKDFKIRFHRNGHILGSCFIEIRSEGKIIIFSGDIGRAKSDILIPPASLEEADILIMESTYGDRLHNKVSSMEQLAYLVKKVVQKKGNLLIPSFALGRAQEFMLLFCRLKEQNKIPDIPVYLDTPMGANVTEVYLKYPSWHKLSKEDCRKIKAGIRVVKDYKQTLKISALSGPGIVIAASGMLTGGRVLTYLKKYLGDKRNTILLAGFQASGTRGRALQEGAHELKIQGAYYPVNATIAQINSLSAHGDQAEMLSWVNGFRKKPEKIFLVHGEGNALQAFRLKLQSVMETEIIIPEEGNEFTI